MAKDTKVPTEVKGIGEAPVPVEIVEKTNDDGIPLERRITEQPVTPKTTTQEDITAESQRTVNLIWETTQMKVALSVTWASLIVASVLAVFGKFLGKEELQLAAIVFLFGVANLVTGFYFGRTNHSKAGGITSPHEQTRDGS